MGACVYLVLLLYMHMQLVWLQYNYPDVYSRRLQIVPYAESCHVCQPLIV